MQSVTVNRKALERALQKVAPAVRARPGIPALSCVRATSSADGLRLETTDLEVAIRTSVPTSASFDGAADFVRLVPFRMLYELVRELDTEMVELGPGSRDSIAIRGGSFAGELRCVPAEDFPAIDASVGDLVVATEAEGFKGMVGAIAVAASKDEARPILTGLLVEAKGRRVTFTATDSYRLHQGWLPTQTSGPGVARIVPARVLSMVAAQVAKASAPVSMWVSGDGQGVVFELDGTIWVSRCIEGEYPNVKQILRGSRKGGSFTWTFDLDEILASVRQAATVCRDASPVRLHLSATPTIQAATPDLGSVEVAVTGAWDGPDLVVAYNPGYLYQSLRAVGVGVLDFDAERVAGLSPVLIRSKQRTAMVMPIRLPAPVEVPRAEEPTPSAEPAEAVAR